MDLLNNMADPHSFRDIGYDNLLSKEIIGFDPLAELEGGGSYNGMTNLVTNSVDPADLLSGEFVEHLINARDGHIRSADCTAYNEGTGYYLGWDETLLEYVFFIGNSAGNKLTWNGSVLAITGTIIATVGEIGGWTITDGYIYNLQSGTPTSSPNDGIVLASGNEAIIVYEDTAKRLEIGYLSAGVYGLKGYATDGSTVVFELSDTQQLIGGFSFTDTQLSAVSGGNTTIVSSGETAFSAGPTGSPTVTITQAGVITGTGIFTATGATSSNLLRSVILYGYSEADRLFGSNNHTKNNRDYFVWIDKALSPDSIIIEKKFGIETASSTSTQTIWADADADQGVLATPCLIDNGANNAVFVLLQDTTAPTGTRIYVCIDPTQTSPVWTNCTISGVSVSLNWARLVSDGTNIYVLDSTDADGLLKFTYDGTSTLTYVSVVTYGTGGNAAVFEADNIFVTDNAVYSVTATQQKKFSLAGVYQNECAGFLSSVGSLEEVVLWNDFQFLTHIYRGGTSSAADTMIVHNLDGLY